MAVGMTSLLFTSIAETFQTWFSSKKKKKRKAGSMRFEMGPDCLDLLSSVREED